MIWEKYFNKQSHKVELKIFCKGLIKANKEFFTKHRISEIELWNLLKDLVTTDSEYITCELLEIKTRNQGLWGWLDKLCSQNNNKVKN